MKILERLRNRSPESGAGDPAAASASAETTSGDDAGLPFPGYDSLDGKEIGDRLRGLSQAELAAVESYERSHQNRSRVLDKLRYMHSDEPLEGYDELTTEQINETLAGADAQTVKAVRDYERKFANRRQVMDEAARVLPSATASAGEDLAREERESRVSEGFAGRASTADGLADDQRSASDG